MRRVAVLGLGALLLAGCASEPPPRPVAQGPQALSSIFVSRGETVYDIAQRYRVPLRDLIETNRLSPPYAVEPGQRLILPTPGDYAVQPGDTLYGIARQFQVDMSEVVRLNGIQPPYVLRAGQTIRLPGRSPVPQATTVAQAPQRAVSQPARPADPTPAPARSTRPAIETAELPPVGQPAQAAPAQAPTTAPPDRAPAVGTGGQAGAAPPQQPRRSVEAEPVPPPAQVPAPPSTPSAAPAGGGASVAAGPVTSAPASRTTAPPPTPAEAPRQQTAALPAVPEAPPARAGKRFAWPVQGEILSDYGPKSDGMRNDGINIAAPAGTPVRAADNGVVAYAGNQLRAFGNLVLIRHADGFVTVYGHLDQTQVEQGTKVAKGQTIGTVGQTGNVRVPQLHFGIRKGEQPLDPKTQLDR